MIFSSKSYLFPIYIFNQKLTEEIVVVHMYVFHLNRIISLVVVIWVSNQLGVVIRVQNQLASELGFQISLSSLFGFQNSLASLLGFQISLSSLFGFKISLASLFGFKIGQRRNQGLKMAQDFSASKNLRPVAIRVNNQLGRRYQGKKWLGVVIWVTFIFEVLVHLFVIARNLGRHVGIIMNRWILVEFHLLYKIVQDIYEVFPIERCKKQVFCSKINFHTKMH